MAEHELPAISIITATYNRSHVLACAIESAIRQNWTDWELIVVGDACTDGTAEVVERFGDPRIRFVNLHRNFGEQAGPNNVGIAQSRAPLVAFLNHDDVWLPHHLTLCREVMLGEQADFVFGASAYITAQSPLPLRFDALGIALAGLGSRGRYSPAEVEGSIAPASSWLVRREVLDRLRGWRLGRDCHADPSQDVLFRAWRRGYRICAVDEVTTVMISSGRRAGSYVSGGAAEQQWVLEHLDEPGFAAELVAQAYEANSRFNVRQKPPTAGLTRLAGAAIARLGVSPRELHFRVRKGLARGRYIELLRAGRGLPVLTSPEGRAPALRFNTVRRACRVELPQEIDFAAGAGGARFLASGWSRPEGHGTWNDGPTAELLFNVGVASQNDFIIDLEVRPFLGAGDEWREVEISAGGSVLDTWKVGPVDRGRRRLNVPATAVERPYVRIAFRFLNPTSPRSLGLSDDARELAVCLVGGRIDISPSGTS